MTKMPKRGSRRKLEVALRVLADLGALLFAFTVSYLVYRALVTSGLWTFRQPPALLPYVRIAFIFAGISLGVFWHLGLYQARVSVLNLWELKTAIAGMAMSAALFFALLFFLKLERYSRADVLASIALATVCVVILRRGLSGVLRTMHLRGTQGWRTLIYGCGETGQLVMKKIVQGPHHDALVVGFLDDVTTVGSTVSCRITQTGPALFYAPVLGRLEDLPTVVRDLSVSELLVTSTMNPLRLAEVLTTCRSCGVEVGVVPYLGGRADQFVVEDLSAIPVLRAHRTPTRSLYLLVKRAFDLVATIVGGLLTLPLWAVAALAIKLDSPGGVFFVQERVGLNGRRFRMYKFRTMRTDTPVYAPSPVGDVDPRITRIGRLLRVGGIDELPQLLNVLKGDMSLVGPRPEMPFIVATYTELEAERLKVTPGITGVWQMSADRHSQIHENLEYDLYYVNNQSFILDILILVETCLFTGGILLTTMFRLGRTPMPAGAGKTTDISLARTSSAHGTAGGHVLMALDQRRPDGHWPESWTQCLPVACNMSARWPIKLLAAGENRSVFDAILEVPLRQVVMPRLEYVAYHGNGELQELISGARVVVTDLWHIAERARRSGVAVLALDDPEAAQLTADNADIVDAFIAGLAEERESPSRVSGDSGLAMVEESPDSASAAQVQGSSRFSGHKRAVGERVSER